MTATGFIIMALIVFAVFYAWYRYANRQRPEQTNRNDRINTDRRRAVTRAQRPLLSETGTIGDLDSDYNTAADQATNYLSSVDGTGKMYYDGTPSPSFQNLVDDLRAEHQGPNPRARSVEQLMVEIGTIGHADSPVALPIERNTSADSVIGSVDGPAVHPDQELELDTTSDLPHDDGTTRSTATPSTNMYDAMATEPAKMEPAYDVHGQQYWVGYQMEVGLIGDVQSLTVPHATPSSDAAQNQTQNQNQAQNAAPVQNATDDCEHPISTLGDVISANPRPSHMGENQP